MLVVPLEVNRKESSLKELQAEDLSLLVVLLKMVYDLMAPLEVCGEQALEMAN